MNGHTKRFRIRVRAFAAELMVDMNGSAAILRCGFKGRRPDVAASKLMAHPYTQEVVAELMRKREQRTEVTQDYVLDTIQETIERCRHLPPATGSRAVLRGAHMLGSHLGMWKQKHEHSGPNGTPIPVSSVDPADAARAYKELMDGDG